MGFLDVFKRNSSQSTGNNSPSLAAGRDINVYLSGGDALAKELGKAVSEHQRSIFTISIIGPYWDTKKEPSSLSDVSSKAQRLRAYLFSKLSEDVTNHVDLGKFHYLKRNHKTLDIAEMDSLMLSDLIVLLPSSPGSFCLTEALTSECIKEKGLNDKLIIILEGSYKNSKGYISRVLFHQRAKDSNIRKHSIDYEQHEKILKKISKVVEEMKRKKQRSLHAYG